MSIHWQVAGPEDGMPLLLLNGLFAGLDSWEPAMPHLHEFRVLRFDARGQGKSPAPPIPYTVDDWLADLEQVLIESKWPPTHVVGISHGGSVGLAFAAYKPERVLSLVAADCCAKLSPLLKLKINTWLVAHRVGGPEHRFDIATPWVWSAGLVRSQPDLVAHYRQRAGSHSDEAVEGLLQGTLACDVDVQGIQAPVLLICGEEDVLTPAWEMRELLKEIDNSRLVEVRGGHASLLEYPVIFSETIVPFLRARHVE
ncbi:MAG: alpha/beta fold hydrolase [Acidobacteria bacterium]|nr:alpha/beta fold hydrolase [Acidobacteriota bacterium]